MIGATHDGKRVAIDLSDLKAVAERVLWPRAKLEIDLPVTDHRILLAMAVENVELNCGP
ncbi:hypothetical protein JCM10599A_66840 [Paraburkholderia kururiensis]